MAAYGLSETIDPPAAIGESADVAGRITEAAAAETGLAAGTPVVGGLFDVVASAIGSGVTRTGAASIIAGTWSINQVIIESPELQGPVFMSSTFDRDRYLAIESSATSAANLEWLVREFFSEVRSDGRSPFDLCCELASSSDPASDDPSTTPISTAPSRTAARAPGSTGSPAGTRKATSSARYSKAWLSVTASP